MLRLILELGLVVIIINSGIPLIMASFSCNPKKKVQYGLPSRTEAKCTQYAACHESGLGCYYSEEKIPGFRIANGECTSCPVTETLSNLERQECARECLKRSGCNCFTYDSVSKDCLIKNSLCHNFDSIGGNRLSYNRFASKKIVCSRADCAGNDINKAEKTAEECYELCKNNSICKVFALMTTSILTQMCIIKSVLCDFTLLENSRIHMSACIPGPVFPDWLKNHYSNRAEIADDSVLTCKSVDAGENFNLKIPWPTVGEDEPNFNITIIGTNLQKCFDLNNGLNEYGVLAFVVYEFDLIPQFTGNFKACQFVSGNDNTQCKYSCSCGLDYCSAVHIRAFASDALGMSVCHYQITQE